MKSVVRLLLNNLKKEEEAFKIAKESTNIEVCKYIVEYCLNNGNYQVIN